MCARCFVKLINSWQQPWYTLNANRIHRANQFLEKPAPLTTHGEKENLQIHKMPQTDPAQLTKKGGKHNMLRGNRVYLFSSWVYMISFEIYFKLYYQRVYVSLAQIQIHKNSLKFGTYSALLFTLLQSSTSSNFSHTTLVLWAIWKALMANPFHFF